MTAPVKPSSSSPSSSGSADVPPPPQATAPTTTPTDLAPPTDTETRLLGEHLAVTYAAVRAATLALASPLSAEDMGAQSMPEASPVKWHLAHTTWFFETFVLAALEPAPPPFDPRLARLFNSYYVGVDIPVHPRAQRGLLTRPDLGEVLRYRQHVDLAVRSALAEQRLGPELLARLELGVQHEQQHQELILTDLQHLLFQNPLAPVFRPPLPAPEDMSFATSHPAPERWLAHPGGVVEVGADVPGGGRNHSAVANNFAFDNEGPRHRVLLAPFEISARPVTNAAYRGFVRDRGYQRPELWLSDGWDAVRRHGWTAPLYWSADLERRFTLHGQRPIDPEAPVCHISYYEADAFARWSGARLPTEHEWESVAADLPVIGNFVESGRLEPAPQLVPAFFGDVWVWTASPYVAYPGFRPATGALGEYNGKFMCNQIVLRGGSCATPRTHMRASYRNFFPPDARWQFSGLRLAR